MDSNVKGVSSALLDSVEKVDDALDDLFDDVCPDCGTVLVSGDNGSGVKCPKCPYWFCY